MSDFKITNYECFDDHAVVSFIADEKIYSQKSCIGEGSRLYDKRDRYINRSKIERHVIGFWLDRNHEKVSERTYRKMHTFIHSN